MTSTNGVPASPTLAGTPQGGVPALAHDLAQTLGDVHVVTTAPVDRPAGGVVVITDRSHVGQQLRIRTTDRARTQLRAGVWEHEGRPVAVFDQLEPGVYEVLDDTGVPVRRTMVHARAVTTIDLRGAA